MEERVTTQESNKKEHKLLPKILKIQRNLPPSGIHKEWDNVGTEITTNEETNVDNKIAK